MPIGQKRAKSKLFLIAVAFLLFGCGNAAEETQRLKAEVESRLPKGSSYVEVERFAAENGSLFGMQSGLSSPRGEGFDWGIASRRHEPFFGTEYNLEIMFYFGKSSNKLDDFEIHRSYKSI
jgi:hypothetical protein